MHPKAPPIFCFRISRVGFHFFCLLILNETAFNDPAPITSHASRYEPATFNKSAVKLAGRMFPALGADPVHRLPIQIQESKSTDDQGIWHGPYRMVNLRRILREGFREDEY